MLLKTQRQLQSVEAELQRAREATTAAQSQQQDEQAQRDAVAAVCCVCIHICTISFTGCHCLWRESRSCDANNVYVSSCRTLPTAYTATLLPWSTNCALGRYLLL